MADLVNVAPIQGRLQVDSTSQISLQRYQGSYIPLKISGVWEAKQIPSSGPTLSNSGLTAATLYYIYAFDSSGTLTLEASVTGHATDSNTGVEIKSGDATRTLLGMQYTDAGSPGTFVDSTAKRYLANWANRSGKAMSVGFSTNRTTASTIWTEINSEIRCQFVTWADEAVVVGFMGLASNNAGNGATAAAIAFDSTTTPDSGTHQMTQSTANGAVPIGFGHVKSGLSEGFHYATLLGAVSTGTATYYGGAISGSTVVNRDALTLMMRG